MNGVEIQLLAQIPKAEFAANNKKIVTILENAGLDNVVTSPAVIIFKNDLGVQVIIDPVRIIVSSDIEINNDEFLLMLNLFSEVAQCLQYNSDSIFNITINCRYKKDEFSNLQLLLDLPLDLPNSEFVNCIGTGFRILSKSFDLDNAYDEFKIEPYLQNLEYLYIEMSSCYNLGSIDDDLAKCIISTFNSRVESVLEKLK